MSQNKKMEVTQKVYLCDVKDEEKRRRDEGAMVEVTPVKGSESTMVNPGTPLEYTVKATYTV